MAEINIYGYIGADFFMDGVTLKSVSDQLEAFKDETDIIVNISSGGGSVNEGKAIYNLLKNSKKTITVNIIGQAYSIASIIAMAGDKIYIAEYGDVMIHPAWVDWAQGNAEDLREIAEQLDMISNELFSIYMTRATAKEKETELKDFFDNEKFMNAQTAIDMGLVDGLMTDNKNKIREYVKYKAVAYYKNNDMKKENIEEAKGLIAFIKDSIKSMFKAEVKNLATTAGDTTLYSEGAISVGTKVFSDEAMTTATADGTYGDYTVSGGEVTAIASEATDSVDELTAKITALTTELDAIKAEKLEAENKIAAAELEKVENKKAIDAMMLKVEELGKVVLGEEGRHKDEDKNDTPKIETMSAKMKRLDAENKAKYLNIN